MWVECERREYGPRARKPIFNPYSNGDCDTSTARDLSGLRTCGRYSYPNPATSGLPVHSGTIVKVLGMVKPIGTRTTNLDQWGVKNLLQIGELS